MYGAYTAKNIYPWNQYSLEKLQIQTGNTDMYAIVWTQMHSTIFSIDRGTQIKNLISNAYKRVKYVMNIFLYRLSESVCLIVNYFILSVHQM
jgi:hypothetical protein